MNMFLFTVADSETCHLGAEECALEAVLEVTLFVAQGQLHA